MPRAKPWLKLWVEWIHDPKMLELTWAEKGMWCGLLSLAQQCNADGYLIKGPGLPLSLEEIAACLHISIEEDQGTLNKLIGRLVKVHCLHWNSSSLVITNFAERQALAPSDMKEAVRDRVQRYREKQKGVTEKPLQPQLPLSPTPPITKDKEGEEEGEEEGEGECNAVTPVTKHEVTLASLPSVNLLASLKTKMRGNVTPNVTVTPVTKEEEETLAVFKTMPGWKSQQDEDLAWLKDLAHDFPSITVLKVKGCRDFWSTQPAKHKGQWKNRLRNWLTKDSAPKKGFATADKPPPGKIATQKELEQWNQ